MKKIMIVDDDFEATSILESLLKLKGYQPYSVNDSTIAADKASLIHPDMFLLDLMMPEIDGFKLCRILRANLEFAHTPIIIITALSDNDSRIVAYGAGATDYITKPYLPKDLLAKIEDFITPVRYDEDGNRIQS
jgi:two-component system alkaline phosphatase synthesis response regulator PhoP